MTTATVGTGDQLLTFVSSLASPQRFRIVAALSGGRTHVSQLARDLQMSRPLLYLHLQKLEGAGVVKGTLELAPDGKAMKYFEVAPFDVRLTPEVITAAAATLTRELPPTKEEA